MYKSPIDVFVADIQHQIAQQQDEKVYKAVVSVGINVDKEELLRALKYDRGQYDKGYADGKADAMASIVRCKDCKWWSDYNCTNTNGARGLVLNGDWFCRGGERREGE